MRLSLRILLAFAVCFFLVLPLDSCVVARPAKPGPGFVWVPARTTPAGILIRGHWVYRGPAQRDRTWIPGHYRPNGTWVSGHWKVHVAPRKGAVWVPGYRKPNGRWVPGHWR